MRRFKDKTLEEIIHRIVQRVNPTKIYLFGSRARDENREDSDYDLAVVYDGKKDRRIVQLEINRMFNPSIGSMDLFVLTSDYIENYKHVANSLAREIAENGRLVYG